MWRTYLLRFVFSKKIFWSANQRVLVYVSVFSLATEHLEWWSSRWWFQICFIFAPIWGDDPIWRTYFSDGLKPPTSRDFIPSLFHKNTPQLTLVMMIGRQPVPLLGWSFGMVWNQALKMKGLWWAHHVDLSKALVFRQYFLGVGWHWGWGCTGQFPWVGVEKHLTNIWVQEISNRTHWTDP